MKLGQRGQSLGGVILLYIAAVILFAMLPAMITAIRDASITGIAGTLAEYSIMFLVLGLGIAVIAWGFAPLLKKMGEHKMGAFYHGRGGQVALGSLIVVIITMMIGFLLLPSLQESIEDVTVLDNVDQHNENYLLTGAGKTMADMFPLFYVLMLIALPLGVLMRAAKKLGV